MPVSAAARNSLLNIAPIFLVDSSRVMVSSRISRAHCCRLVQQTIVVNQGRERIQRWPREDHLSNAILQHAEHPAGDNAPGGLHTSVVRVFKIHSGAILDIPNPTINLQIPRSPQMDDPLRLHPYAYNKSSLRGLFPPHESTCFYVLFDCIYVCQFVSIFFP